MIPRDQLPDDASDWADVSVSFPRLAQDIAESNPYSEDEVFAYVQMESAGMDSAQRQELRFIRTALVAEAKYWIWEYRESDGELYYVALRLDPDGSTILGLSATLGLSHEQYLLADYYGEIYWS